jgi:hypothetical protein
LRCTRCRLTESETESHGYRNNDRASFARGRVQPRQATRTNIVSSVPFTSGAIFSSTTLVVWWYEWSAAQQA